MKKLSNVSLIQFRNVLKRLGLSYVRTNGGHEMWRRADLTRDIVFQTHKDPIPEFIVKSCIHNLGITREDFLKVLEEV